MKRTRRVAERQRQLYRGTRSDMPEDFSFHDYVHKVRPRLAAIRISGL